MGTQGEMLISGEWRPVEVEGQGDRLTIAGDRGQIECRRIPMFYG